MAQTQHQQYSSQPFSPPISSPSPGAASSPVNGGGIPPAQKRPPPRLSPHPQSQSPFASPGFGMLQLPQNNPPPTPNMNGSSSMNGYAPTTAPPPPPPPPGTMGPPSRPTDRATDAAELTDVLASSGIDVREEEAYLTSSYSAPGAQVQHPPRAAQAHLPALNTSFTSQSSAGATGSAGGSFTTDPSFLRPAPTQESMYTEPSSQPSVPFKDPNEPTREDTLAARRAQYHLQEPFLLTKVLEHKLQKRGSELGVRIPSEGLYHPMPGRSQPIEATGPDGSSVVRTGQTIINQEGAPLVDILNLLSLSCEDRLRSVVEYSSTLARSRRAHSHGVVPIEWRDLAQQSPRPVNGVSGTTKPSLKRPHSAIDKYRALMEKDTSHEEKRSAKRAKRDANAILESQGKNPESNEGPASGGTNTAGGGEKAAVPEKKGVSKKEAKKQIDVKASEAQQHQQSVETARLATSGMMSGRMFGNNKKYSWLTQATAGGGFSTPSRPGTATAGGGADKGGGRGGEATSVSGKRLGYWREDKEKGAGIQVRDILFMLEVDGRGARHVQKAYAKDVKEDRVD